ncbi:hypothetical protein GWI33_001633 [Rhynchophorus ferrugineus]|uniref:Uncharacterized protein n=1 Tax=Rhynchophorus ferrugineus TaxID=354439 RepID=A0A834IRY6_RHYFE|nr:hypothetical protein GWI33_001633 [Rhynchophorus ferrugineus]
MFNVIFFVGVRRNITVSTGPRRNVNNAPRCDQFRNTAYIMRMRSGAPFAPTIADDTLREMDTPLPRLLPNAYPGKKVRGPRPRPACCSPTTETKKPTGGVRRPDVPVANQRTHDSRP